MRLLCGGLEGGDSEQTRPHMRLIHVRWEGGTATEGAALGQEAGR